MAAGVTDKLWSMEDLAQLVEDYEAGNGLLLPKQNNHFGN